ncbi:general transcription factor 3C polypeptide 2 [Etheostoma cragini]|uniref:general transcription factor 3C polypeptide 2 n=1 Tax=Etheostoma cragini TaxID=417921 RepID=UPI00155E5532|nr:general transcription factor 3C polypeptide 2 [Etheostoma cragini]
MDPIDSQQGPEKLSEQCFNLSLSSKGRQRKINPKYSDYETDGMYGGKDGQKQRRKSPEAASKKTPAKRGKAKNASHQTEDGEKEAAFETPQESEGKTSEETPEKAVRARKTPTKKTPARKTPTKKTPVRKTPTKKTPARKTPTKKTPAKKTPTTDGGLATGEGGIVDAVQQENGTPKPKRKYVRKQPAPEPVPEPPCQEAQEEPEETTPSGRHRRGAAKAALKYLHIFAKEALSHPNDESGSQAEDTDDVTRKHSLKDQKGRKGRKRKRPASDSDAAEDEDFVPGVEEDEDVEEEEEEEEEAGDSDSDSDSDLGTGGRSPGTFHVNRQGGSKKKAANGLVASAMNVVCKSTDTTKKFREEHYSSWVFPEWVPSSSHWHPVPQSKILYLFQVLKAFLLVTRFTAVPSHPDRWDMLLYAGGPVWAMEWCPTPDGAPATQYLALGCHRGMDDQHYVNKMYSGPGLIQLWDLGMLEYNSRPDSQPAFAYGLAQDKGFIWQLKWCPAGGWELPSCGRKAPFLPRVGLLAVATSTGVVTIYSLPHPDALHSNRKQAHSGKASEQLPIYQARGVLTLKLGSFKAPRHQRSGQVLSMDWLPQKPHNIMAIGFYDGVVGLWDLSTKSSLLRVREPGESLSLLPYRCLLAHDHAVRALAFCPASRYLLVTAGEDRYVKTWDLRRLHDPITVQKRYLTNEIYWPLNGPGLLLAQENAYVPYASQGVHYFDHSMRTFFAIPRTGTVWSLSFTDWMNSVVTADSFGEVIFSLLPQICFTPQYLKRTIERRFPVYITTLLPHGTNEEENPETGGVEDGHAAEEKEGGETEGPDAESEEGSEHENGNGEGEERVRRDKGLPLPLQTYKEAVKRYCLLHTDFNMRTFKESEKQAVWKHMKDTEVKRKLNLDDLPIAALHKVRFNPNMCCHTWVVSAGQTGLVRLNCLRTMITAHAKEIIGENQAQFNALYSPKEPKEASQTGTDEL